MSIAINTECLQCFLSRQLKTARELGSEEQAFAFFKELMAHCLTAPDGVGSAWLTPGAEALLQKHYGTPADRFAKEKKASNAFALARMDEIDALARRQADPVLAGLKFSILGNYLDFVALGNTVSFEKLEQMLREALDMELDTDCYGRLCADLQKGGQLLYITDNCGEIVFDRILAQLIAESYPQVKITFCVRGGPAHNDAAREAAEEVGIPFPVIDNGCTVGGMELSLIGQEAMDALQRADIVIAKGMGNTETMYGCGYNVYYAFLVKCQRFMSQFGKPMLTPMLVGERQGSGKFHGDDWVFLDNL